MHLKYFLISFCLLLASCGKWQWIGKNAPSNSLEKDIIRCKNYANREFPSKTYYQKNSRYDASATRDGTGGITIRPIEHIDIQAYDANQEDRKHTFKDCMLKTGWQLEY